MPKIIIGNNDNESMVGDPRVFTPDFLADVGKIAGRTLWFAQAGDIAIMPQAVPTMLLDYIADLQGRPRGSLHVVVPRIEGRDIWPLGRPELMHPDTIRQVRALMAGHRDWQILAYHATRDVKELADALGIGEVEAVRPFLAEGGAELLNDKRIFRVLVAGRGIPIAPGTVATSRSDLARAIEELLDHTGSVIVKQDRHMGGFGNIIVNKAAGGPTIGATRTFAISEDGSLPQICDQVWSTLAYHDRTPLVVEAYYPAKLVLTSEFLCIPSKNTLEFQDWGQLRQAPIFEGIIMPPQAPSYTAAHFISKATEIARLCMDLGFEGLINIDGIVTQDDTVVFNEFNGRVGACSHMHRIAETVAGRTYGDRLVMATFSVQSIFPIERVFDIVRAERLGFDRTADRGLVITSGKSNPAGGKVEIVTLAPSIEEIIAIEQRFKALLTQPEAAAA